MNIKYQLVYVDDVNIQDENIIP